MESECAGNFFPIIGKRPENFSNHWKKRPDFSNHWKKVFQPLEKTGRFFQPLESFFPIIGKPRGDGFAVGAAWARKEVAKRGWGAILQAVL